MAKTNFSGPITTGPIQVNTGTTIGENVRDASFVSNMASFPLSYSQHGSNYGCEQISCYRF
jgi:hypothetical protein